MIDTMSAKLKIYDIVSWRGTWGKDAPKDAKVTAINCNSGNGIDVNSVDWSKVNDRTVIVSLENGHWAYGNQITKK